MQLRIVWGFRCCLRQAVVAAAVACGLSTRGEDFVAQFEQASAEAQAAFGNAEIYLERFFPQVRHIEIQVFGDQHGNHVHLGERDCSVQRRHQKACRGIAHRRHSIKPTRARMAEAAVALIKALDYVNAGTVEFIFDPASGKFFFIEMNTRIQVEHPVTEMVTGTDLVIEQFRVAAGEKLSFGSTFSEGRTAIEFRINAEDAAHDFRPSPGILKRWRPPSGRDIRVDSHAYENYAVPALLRFHVGQTHCHGARSRGRNGSCQIGTGPVSGVRDSRPPFRSMRDFCSARILRAVRSIPVGRRTTCKR